MSILEKIAYFKGRRDEALNKELARELARTGDRQGIGEIAKNMSNENANISSDCIKVMYEIGYIEPSLIADYVDDFLGLQDNKNNRMVWGAMRALATIASLKPDELYDKIDLIKKAFDNGSVITRDCGIALLASVASAKPSYEKKILPYLLEHLSICRAKDIPQHFEKCLPAVNKRNKEEFTAILEQRLDELTPTQKARARKVLRYIDEI